MNYRSNLIIQYRMILKSIGWLFINFSVILLLPLLVIPFYPSEAIYGIFFLFSAFLCFSCGILLKMFFSRGTNDLELSVQQGAIIVVFFWAIAILFSALPFMLSGLLNFTQSVFESMSGWTTTGLTVMDVRKVPKVFLLWRSLTQYFGGAGFAVIMLSSIAGGVSAGIYQAEGRTDNLLPNLKKSAKFILLIYGTYAIVGSFALVLTGLTPFDAINHSLTSLATGGFSTKIGSLGDFNNLGAEIVCMVLMILGATGFGIHFLLWQRNFAIVKKNSEPWLFFILILIFTPMVFAPLLGTAFSDIPTTFRHAIFQAISAISGTGLQTTDLVGWPSFSLYILLLLMIFGGMMDSTAGGLKTFRIYIILKAIAIEIVHFFLPKNSVKIYFVWKGNLRFQIDNTLIKNVANYLVLYFITYAIGTGILTAYGNDYLKSSFEFASALSNVGLTVGITLPTSPVGLLWTEIFGMFLGRLEFIVILFAFSKIIRDSLQMLENRK